MRKDGTTRLIQVCLDIANLADEKGEAGEPYFEELGLGYRALSGILRKGVKDVIDLQNSLHGAISERDLAKLGEKEAHDFLEEVFGDREPYTLGDSYKERIRDFMKDLLAEMEEE